MSAAERLNDPRPQSISPQARQYIARRAIAELCKRSLYEMLIRSWPILEPGVPYEDNWHVKVFCDHIQAMLEGWLVANGHGNKRILESVRAHWRRHGLDFIPGELLVQNLILNLPPITLKSRILMVIAPAWMWLHCPSWSVCCISSVDDNVKRDSNAHRDLVTSKWYRETFLMNERGVLAWEAARNDNKGRELVYQKADGDTAASWKVRSDVDAVGEWMTTAGGERKSRTMLGGFTGVHVDAIFLDDPDDAYKVHSESKRKEVHGKWKDAIKNRVKHPDRSIRIAIQQRVHVDDWTAAQIAKGIWSATDRKAWAWVVLPLQYGQQPEDAPRSSPWFASFDQRTVANENMQPKRFSEAFIADEERDKGPEGFAGQYNQNPRAFDGGMIKRHMVRYFRVEGDPWEPKALPLGTGMNTETGEIEAPYIIKRDEVTGRLLVDWVTVIVDCSNGSELLTASAVGILVVAGIGQMRFCLDDRTDIMSIDRMYDEVKAAICDYRAGTALIEKKAAGPSVINELERTIAQGDLKDSEGNSFVCVVEDYDPGKDSKEGRAIAMLPHWRQGLVYLRLGAHWLYPKLAKGGRTLDQGHVGEVTSFPQSKRNDRIDCWSMCITWYRIIQRGAAKLSAKW